MPYHSSSNADSKYNIDNMPPEKYRLKEEEIISNEEYLQQEKNGGAQRTDSFD